MNREPLQDDYSLQAPQGTEPVSDPLLARVQQPYKPHCRYIRSATVRRLDQPGQTQPGDKLVEARAQFGIAESCYIDETGHFNSVEFNLCYNQLIYVLLAQSAKEGLLDALGDMTLDHFYQRMLPDVLIHDFACRFSKPMDRRHFEGLLTVLEAKDHGHMILLRTHCQFSDSHGGLSLGNVSLAIVDSSATSTTRHTKGS
ncbi:MAG: hypothetical protein ACI9EF_003745 [Pseudohongiellaceae bacterium]|jgi:hypothetical protein